MKITTEGIIKVLPFEEEYRTQLLQSLTTLDLDKKANVEQVLWDTYFAFYKMKFDENMKLELVNMSQNNLPVNDEFYARVTQKTEQDMLNEFVDTSVSVDLTDARTKIDQILQAKTPATN